MQISVKTDHGCACIVHGLISISHLFPPPPVALVAQRIPLWGVGVEVAKKSLRGKRRYVGAVNCGVYASGLVLLYFVFMRFDS